MIRKLTVTYELPEELWNVLEQKAACEGRPMEFVVVEYWLRAQSGRPPVSAEETERRHRAFLACFEKDDSSNLHGYVNVRVD